jgi:hypothetical protein
MAIKSTNSTLVARAVDHESQMLTEEKLATRSRRKVTRQSSPELDPRQADLRARWQLQRWEAAVWRDSQLKTVARVYEREMEKFSLDSEEKNESVRVAMLTKRLNRLKSLAGHGVVSEKPEHESILATSVPLEPISEPTGPSGRILRSKQKPPTTEPQSSAATGVIPNNGTTSLAPARRRNFPFFDTTLQRLGVSIALSDSEISTDMSQISKQPSSVPSSVDTTQQNVKKASTGATRTSTRNIPSLVKGPSSVVECSIDARITELGTLVYEGHEFVTGDTVKLEINGSRFSGTLSSVQSAEIWIRRDDDGTKNKIYLGQLRVGRYRIVI